MSGPVIDYEVRFIGGPFDGRRGVVSSRSRSCPGYIYVLPDGGIVSYDLIRAQDPEAGAAARRGHLYAVELRRRGDGPHAMLHLHGPAPEFGDSLDNAPDLRASFVP